MEHGHLLVLYQPAELVLIGGAALGTVLIANPLPTIIKIIKGLIGNLGGNPFSKAFYMENLKMLFELFQSLPQERHGESGSGFEDLPRFAHSVDALQRNPERVVGACEARVNLTPEWGLPPFQIAQQFVNAGAPGKAIPYLEKAVSFNPRSVINRWNLVHVLRRANNPGRGERESAELIRLDPNYAPSYLELGQIYEMPGKPQTPRTPTTPTSSSPNFAGTAAVRARAAIRRR